MTTPSTFESAQDALAASLPSYERREAQGVLAKAIEAHLAGTATEVHLLGEAGCGTGKSLGYLIPAILSGKRVIVSTATKALQDQVAFKDLPFLQEHLGVPFTYAVLKGKSNYFCQVAGEKAAIDNPQLMKGIYAKLNEEKDNEKFLAEKDNFDGIDPRDWSSVTTSADDCPGRRKCPFGASCYAERAKDFAKEAQIVVVNHALFLTDLRIRDLSEGSVGILGEYDVAIIDEAHELEEYATSCWQFDLRERSLVNLSADLKNFSERVGTKSNEGAARLSGFTGPLTASIQQLWSKLPLGRLLEGDVGLLEEEIMNLYSRLNDVSVVLGDIDLSGLADEKAREGNRKKLQQRVNNLIGHIASLATADFASYVRWTDVETVGKNKDSKILHCAPISVSEILRERLFDSGPVCILVSATLSANKKFDFIAKRLGIDSYCSVDVGSVFDYENRSLLYVPTHLPEPTQANISSWSSQSINEIKTLVTTSNGRALVLFTSVKQMKLAYSILADQLPYSCFVQGEGSNKELAEKFMADNHSVLFATKSFFTGVDFSGDTCSLVIIDKLVFDVPTDPIFQARCEAIERAGGKSFFDYSVPKMNLTLKQGHGRLLRTKTDRGVVAILDPRVKTKGYGKSILNSLPNSPVVTTIEEVREFFERGNGSV